MFGRILKRTIIFTTIIVIIYLWNNGDLNPNLWGPERFIMEFLAPILLISLFLSVVIWLISVFLKGIFSLFKPKQYNVSHYKEKKKKKKKKSNKNNKIIENKKEKLGHSTPCCDCHLGLFKEEYGNLIELYSCLNPHCSKVIEEVSFLNANQHLGKKINKQALIKLYKKHRFSGHFYCQACMSYNSWCPTCSSSLIKIGTININK